MLSISEPTSPSTMDARAYHKEKVMNRPYSIILADGHQMVRQGVRKIVEEMEGLFVAAEASDGRQLLEITKNIMPDLVIVDISIPYLRDLNAINAIRGLGRGVKVLLLSMHDHQEYLDYALEHGAEGFVFKQNVDVELLPAIEKIRHGETYITPAFPGY